MTGFDKAALVVSAVLDRPLVEIAEASGVSISTVQRKLKDPEIVALVHQTIELRICEMMNAVGAAVPAAIAQIVALLEDDNSSIRLRAARTVLDTFVHLAPTHALAVEVAALKQPIEGSL